MTRALEAIGAEVISCPTIEIKEPSSWEQLDRALVHLSWYDWLAFTSVNGVEYGADGRAGARPFQLSRIAYARLGERRPRGWRARTSWSI